MSTTRKTKAAPKKELKAAVKTVKKKAGSAAKPKAGAKAKAGSKAPAVPLDEQIAALAYEIWQQAGCPEGRSDEHWREAEARLRESGG